MVSEPSNAVRQIIFRPRKLVDQRVRRTFAVAYDDASSNSRLVTVPLVSTTSKFFYLQLFQPGYFTSIDQFHRW